jgi:DNA-binding IclR family transcriptional regulator
MLNSAKKLEQVSTMLNSGDSKAVLMVAKILSLFSLQKEEVGIREVSRILPLSRSGAYRLLSSLEKCGFLKKDLTKQYRLGLKVFEIGSLFPYHFSLRRIVRPHAEQLAREFGATVRFAIPNETEPYSVIMIDYVGSMQPDVPVRHVPVRHVPVHRFSLNIPLHSTALGKAILAFLPPEQARKVITSLVLSKFTRNTIRDKKKLYSELRRIREKDGFAVDREETYDNLFCVAAPIFQNEILVGSLSLSDSIKRLNGKNCLQIGGVLRERTAFISAQL